MSCIPKLLSIKGGNAYLRVSNGAILESGGTYKGYDFCVTFTSLGHRCGYVAVPATHARFKGVAKLDIDCAGDIEVHGGITFCGKPEDIVNKELLGDDNYGDIWVGFDAAHLNDCPDIEKAENLFLNAEDQHYYKFKKQTAKKYALLANDDYFKSVIRSNEYMAQECKNVIDQLCDNTPRLMHENNQ